VLIPVALALVVGGLILLVLGKDPLDYYGFVLQRSLLRWGGIQETVTRMAPLLLIAAGLIVAFRAGIWNLGGDGQFLLAAVASAALAPVLAADAASRR
jgi:general nucleoside transport system permease protein